MKVSLKVSPDDPRTVIVEVSATLRNRRGLNAVLGQRLADELTEHFRAKNAKPNKQGWKKTNFWEQIAGTTAVSSVTKERAIVTVADQRFAIHLFGGTIKPTGGRKFLTIPLVEQARGLNVASYERKTKRELFRIGHARVLFEKRSRGGTQSLVSEGEGTRYRGGSASSVKLSARQQLRAVYALCREVTIPDDPTALPPMETILAALNQEAADFLQLEMTKAKGNKQ